MLAGKSQIPPEVLNWFAGKTDWNCVAAVLDIFHQLRSQFWKKLSLSNALNFWPILNARNKKFFLFTIL